MIRVNFLKEIRPKTISRPEVPRVTSGGVLMLVAVFIVLMMFASLLMRSFWGEDARDGNSDLGAASPLGGLYQRSGPEDASSISPAFFVSAAPLEPNWASGAEEL
ncbi:MAG: hypothetical protein ACE5OR_03925 [bacterium]